MHSQSIPPTLTAMVISVKILVFLYYYKRKIKSRITRDKIIKEINSTLKELNLVEICKYSLPMSYSDNTVDVHDKVVPVCTR